MEKFQIKGNYFNGSFQLPPTSGANSVERIINRKCPSDLDRILWSCPVDYRHIESTIQSAIEGFTFWRKLDLKKRIEFLKKYQEEVTKRADEISIAIALETGKPLWEAKTETSSVIGKVDVTINDSLPRIKNQRFENILPDTTGHVYFKPIGPCLVIGPFNFPCHLANTQILSSLIAGNSIIFKPSEKTCYSAQLLIECFHQAGFPKGVVNLLQGDGEMSGRLLKEKTIKGVFFTGSKEVGLKILENTYHDLTKLVALELGGKNPAIVHHDADITHTLTELLRGCYLTAGQRCTSTSIVIIHKKIMDEFISKFHNYSKRIIIDHPINYDQEPFMGPLIDQQAVDNYLNFMGMAKREGIVEIMRGKQLERKTQGYFVSPSIHYADNFDSTSHFLMSEIFGPNCTFVPYTEIDEAIAIANATEYGLAASLFTNDKSLYDKCCLDIDSGLLNYNRSTVGASAKLPFGGVKNSGNYHPAAVTSIDACVYMQSSLEYQQIGKERPEDIKGISAQD